jgi:hypothetical protein
LGEAWNVFPKKAERGTYEVTPKLFKPSSASCLRLDEDEIDAGPCNEPYFWEAISHDVWLPFGINGEDDALGVNKEVFPVQSRRLEKDPPNEDDIRISANLCELKPLNQNIKATPDDEPWNEDNDDFDALDDGTWNLPFRTNYWQNSQGPIWNSGFMVLAAADATANRAGVLHTDPQQTKRAIKINAKREAVVLATSKKSHLEYMKKFQKLSRA